MGPSNRFLLACFAVSLFTSAGFGQGVFQHEYVRIPELVWTPRSDWMNVRTAGAKGDGVTDDTDAIQQVLNRLSDKRPKGEVRQHVVYFPPGKYRITRTLTVTESTGGWLVGHGRSTELVWDGEEGGRMYWSNGCRYVCYEGLTWDGRDKAAILVEHQSQSYYETWIRYLHCAFVNARFHGLVVGHGGAKNESAELWFRNCLFAKCDEGVSLLSFNDYDNIFDGCEFARCGTGVHAIRGNWQIRGCRFQQSRVSDVKQDDISHGSSLRFCVSIGSRRFLETCRSNVPMPMQIEGCRVDGWTASDGAISLGHPGPVTLFDCAFEQPTNPSPPVVLASSQTTAQTLLASSNAAPPGTALLEAGPKALVTEIPAGKRTPVLPGPKQGFLRDQVFVPAKVFDAKVDFGAKGDGKSDDTDAIQRAIDAARQHSQRAIAYLPGGDYAIARTLKIEGGDYHVGGIGMATRLLWKGAAGGVAIHVDTPQNVVLENFSFEQRNDTYTRIRQTARGPCAVLYDQVEVSHYNDPPEGIVCENLPAGAKVRFGLFTGKVHLADCGRADILALIHYGRAIIDGAEHPKTGFTGFMFHNAALPFYALEVRDNQDVVVADYYMEQSTHYLLCEGGKRPGKGRVTIGASKISSKDAEAVTLRNYEGRVWIGGGDAQWEKDRMQPVHLKQEGERPVWFLSAGNAWCESEPVVNFGAAARFARLGDVTSDKHRRPLPNQVPSGAMLEAAAALDDFRELGAAYLKDQF